MKIAIIVVRLVPEGDEATDSQIEKEVREDSTIPWAKEIEKVVVSKLER